MEKDKAIQKALQEEDEGGFPLSLRNRIMANVQSAAAKRKKIMHIRNIILVSGVSLLLAAGAVYLLVTRFDISFAIPEFTFSSESKSVFISSVFIGSIILSLLIIDSLLRKRYERHKRRFS